MRQALFTFPTKEADPSPSPVRQKKAKERGPAILVRRQGATLIGCADMDVELITQLDANAPLKVRVTQERHAGRLRLYWVILQIVARNLDQPMRPEPLHQAVKLMLGVSTVVPFGDRDVMVPGSIAFDSMSEPEFREFLDRFLALVTERLLPGVDIRNLEAEGRREAGPTHAALVLTASSRTEGDAP